MITNDFIETPVAVTEALLRHEKFTGGILEPCCGGGAISKVLIGHGYELESSDKFPYGYGAERDLFDITGQYDNIITNPPFTQQATVKKHLLPLARKKLALLWYVKNLGNEVESRAGTELKTVYVFRKRIEWVGIKFGWLFAWYVWEKGWTGDITVKRIDW